MLALVTKSMSLWPIAAATVVPTVAALLVARLFWRKDSTVGNIIGSGVIAVVMVGFISREYADLNQQRLLCVARDLPCVFRPTDFMRYAIYASIGFVEVMVVYAAGLWFEERNRRRERAPEWQ